MIQWPVGAKLTILEKTTTLNFTFFALFRYFTEMLNLILVPDRFRLLVSSTGAAYCILISISGSYMLVFYKFSIEPHSGYFIFC